MVVSSSQLSQTMRSGDGAKRANGRGDYSVSASGRLGLVDLCRCFQKPVSSWSHDVSLVRFPPNRLFLFFVFPRPVSFFHEWIHRSLHLPRANLKLNGPDGRL